MNSPKVRAFVSLPTVATVLAGAALLLGGCATTTASREPGEKSVTYPQLHRQMVKLAEESGKGGAARPIEALSTASADLVASPTLASNP